MKRTVSAFFSAVLLIIALGAVGANAAELYSDFEEGKWTRYLVSPSGYQNEVNSFFSFGDKLEDGNSVKCFKFTNPPESKDLNVRCKRDFAAPVQLSADRYTVIHCKIKLVGDNAATYQLRAYTSSGKQEILIGFGENVTIYKNHIAQSTEYPVYCDFGKWHSVDIVISGENKTMMHYFDGKPVSGEPVGLYTFSDNTQFVGPYNSLAVVCYSGGGTGTQEFLLDDVKVYNPEEGALIASTPINGEKSVNPNHSPVFEFNNYIDKNSFKDAYAEINGEKAALSPDADNPASCTAVPCHALKPNTSCTASVKGLKDIFGNSLQAEIGFVTSSDMYIKERVVTVKSSDGETRNITNAAITGGRVTANLIVGNEEKKEGTVKAVFALFDGERLVRLGSVANVSVSSEESEKAVTAEISVSEAESEALCLKLFVFNGSTLKPLDAPWQPKLVYFVSPQGADGNPGSKEKPFKTMEKAARTVRAGDIVIFEDGEYFETRRAVFQNGGTKDCPILLKARRKGKAKITFMSSENTLLKIKEKITIPKTTSGYITVQDFVITQDTAAASADKTTVDIFINCRADNCSVIGNEIYNCYEEAVKAADVTGLTVMNNNIYQSEHEGIDFVNVADSVIAENTIGEVGRVGIMVKGGSRSISICGNTVYSEAKSMETAISIGGATDSTSAYDTSENGYEGYNQYVWNNVVYVMDKSKARIDTAVLFDGTKDCCLFNNTLVGTRYAIRFTTAPGIKNGWQWNPNNSNPRVYNNLITDSIYGVYETTKAEGLVSDYNLFFNCYVSSAVDGNNSLPNADPKFKNAAAWDFGIGDDSPAKYAGIKLDSRVPGFDNTTIILDTSDFLKTERGARWSVGAYQ